MKNISVLLFLLITLALNAQNNKTSGLNARQFHKYWKVESESPDYKVTFLGDTVEILSPKGLTLWRKEKMNEENLTYADAMQRLEDISARQHRQRAVSFNLFQHAFQTGVLPL